MNTRRATIAISFVILLVLAGTAWFFRSPLRESFDVVFSPPLPPPQAFVPTVPSEESTSPPISLPPVIDERPAPSPNPDPTPSSPPSTDSTIPASYNLDVPFTSQAPFEDWSMPWQEACEEASVLMVHFFYEGRSGVIPPEEARDALNYLFDFEESLGFGVDTTALQTGLLADQAYGLSTVEILNDPTIDDIRRQVAAGHPVIVPVSGKALPNPYFRNGGPVYHMLVVKGYTQTHFITHDPGTRRGANFLYTHDALMNAIHDWNEGNVVAGDRVVLVVSPEAL